MLARALIVLLVVLNAGVALWWATRSDTAPVAAAGPASGAERLQLLREAPHVRATKPASPAEVPALAETTTTTESADPAAATPAEPQPAEPAPVPEQCYAVGPFAQAAARDAARQRLQPRASRLHLREVASTQARDWRVWLPPQADRAAAQALAGRIAAAGFDDYFIVAGGDEANSIALGRYRSEQSARRREAALHAGGFTDVRAQALGEASPPQAWIDIAVIAPLAAAERRELGAARVDAIDCATVP